MRSSRRPCSRALAAAGGAHALLVGGAVAPALARLLGAVVRRAHALDGAFGAHAARQVEAVVRRLQAPGRRLPIRGRRTGACPSRCADRAASRALTQTTGYSQGMSGNSNWSMQALAPAPGVASPGRTAAPCTCRRRSARTCGFASSMRLRSSFCRHCVGRQRVLRDRRVALADEAGAGEDRAHPTHLLGRSAREPAATAATAPRSALRGGPRGRPRPRSRGRPSTGARGVQRVIRSFAWRDRRSRGRPENPESAAPCAARAAVEHLMPLTRCSTVRCPARGYRPEVCSSAFMSRCIA